MEKMARYYAVAFGELKPDFVSSRIQSYLSHKHGLPVDWSHCGILVEGHELETMNGVWDSTGRGFERCTLEEALDNGHAVMRHKVLLPVFNPWAAGGWCRGNKGRWYARAQYVLYFMPRWMRTVLGKVLPGPIKKLFANGRALQVCSESLHYFILDNVPKAEETLNAIGGGDTTDPFEVIKAAYHLAEGAIPISMVPRGD
jgi:hypothetical protein